MAQSITTIREAEVIIQEINYVGTFLALHIPFHKQQPALLLLLGGRVYK